MPGSPVIRSGDEDVGLEILRIDAVGDDTRRGVVVADLDVRMPPAQLEVAADRLILDVPAG